MGISRRIFDTSVQKNVAEIDDQLVEFSSSTTGTPSGDAGIIVNRGSSDNVFVGWDELEDKVVAATTSGTGNSTGDLSLTTADFKCKDIETTGDITITGGDLSFGNGQNATAKVAAVTGTNTPGKNLTIAGGQGTGSGAGGSVIIQVADGGGSGSSANALATAVTIADDKKASFAGDVDITGGLSFDAGTAVTSIDTDISSVSGSDDTLASAKAIKTYVDAQVTAQDLDMTVDGSGTFNVDLDSQALNFVSGTNIDVSASGQSVTIAVDMTESSAATIAAGDNILFLDGGASGTHAKGSINDVATLFAGTASSTGLSASSGVISVSDLHPVGVDGSANQLITDDGDGTVTSESNLSFNGSTLAVTGALTTTTTATVGTDLTVTGDIILDDGGSLKEAGGTAAITFDGSGHVTKIGQDTPSNGQFLKYDGAKWVADTVSGTVAGSVAADDISAGDSAITISTSTGNITIDAQENDSDIIFKGTDGGVDTTFLTLDGSLAGKATFSGEIVAPSLDISGNVDIDGTLEADAITLNGSALATSATTDTTNASNIGSGTLNAARMASAQTAVESVLNTSLIVGRDADNQIKFGTDNEITFRVSANDGVVMKASGEIEATSLDISGDADIDGTLEADAITVGGTALNTVIAGVTVTNATNAVNATHVSVADNESTDENNLITFIENASATGNVGLESDGDFHYNPSSGTVTATIFKGNIDAVDGDFDGTLEADAITIGGTALNTVIAGVTVTNATNAVNATHVSVADNESTDENNLIPFIEDASATGNVGLESDGDFHYNPSSGTVSATNFLGTTVLATELAFTDGDSAMTIADGGGCTFPQDVNIIRDANNADVKLVMGTSAAESLTIQVLNGGSNKTAEEIHFSTATASTNLNDGKFVFDVDGTDILEINDNGLSMGSGKGIGVAEITDGVDGTSSITIADSGACTFPQAAIFTSGLSANDQNITNVADVALDSISADGNTIEVKMDDNQAGAFEVKQGSDSYLKISTTDNQEEIVLAKANAISFGGSMGTADSYSMNVTKSFIGPGAGITDNSPTAIFSVQVPEENNGAFFRITGFARTDNCATVTAFEVIGSIARQQGSNAAIGFGTVTQVQTQSNGSAGITVAFGSVIQSGGTGADQELRINATVDQNPNVSSSACFKMEMINSNNSGITISPI